MLCISADDKIIIELLTDTGTKISAVLDAGKQITVVGKGQGLYKCRPKLADA